jgi:ABC-type transporter Mla maintaining outer membrane lipid asymmetry permease subunit MlaE
MEMFVEWLVNVLMFTTIVCGAGKERIFVSISSVVYLSNIAAFVESRDIVRCQNYAVYFALKRTCSEPFE